MMRSRFSESQIAAILNEGEAGILVVELCRKHSVNNATYYFWQEHVLGTYRSSSYSDYVNWKLKMPSSNVCSRSGVGKYSEQRLSKPKILTPLAKREVIEQLVQTRLLATIEWSQLEQETHKSNILRYGFEYAFATQKETAGLTSAAFGTGQCAKLLLGSIMHDTLLNAIDEANRECLTIEIGTSIPSARLIRVLSRLIDC